MTGTLEGTATTVGFVGLGNMGAALAANLVAAGFDVVAYDAAGPDRVPAGATGAADVAEIAGRAGVIVFSLPDGAACEQVADKFPNHVLPGRYAAGFTNSLMAKDLALYLAAVREQNGSPQLPGTSRIAPLGSVTASVWERFAAVAPGADFTRIYPFVKEP